MRLRSGNKIRSPTCFEEEPGGERPSCSRATRPDGSPPTLPSCPTVRVPLHGTAAGLQRLEACFNKNERQSTETNPFVAPSRAP
jgi:hypothetical protein